MYNRSGSSWANTTSVICLSNKDDRPGFEIQVWPRSGLDIKHGITIINAPGTIAADYRGEIKIGLINLGENTYTVRRGDRIAQLIVQRVYQASIALVDELDETERNEGGFGHTGK